MWLMLEVSFGFDGQLLFAFCGCMMASEFVFFFLHKIHSYCWFTLWLLSAYLRGWHVHRMYKLYKRDTKKKKKRERISLLTFWAQNWLLVWWSLSITLRDMAFCDIYVNLSVSNAWILPTGTYELVRLGGGMHFMKCHPISDCDR